MSDPTRSRPDGARKRFALVAACVALVYLAGGFDFVDRKLTELRFHWIRRSASEQMVLVAIDAKSLQALGEDWTGSRDRHADVIDALMTAGARRVAFDLDVSAAADPAGDAAFTEALEAHGERVVLPVFRQWEQDASLGARLVMTKPLPAFRDHAGVGMVTTHPGDDGLTHRYAAQVVTGEGHQPALAAALLDRQAELPEWFEIDFGINLDSIPRLSYVDVLRNEFDPAAVEGRAVFVGATAVELARYLTVPRFGMVPEAAVQALAFESLVQDRALHQAPVWLILAGIFVLALTAGPMMPAVHWRRGFVTTVVLASVALLTTVMAQAIFPMMIEAGPWVATIVGCYGAGLMRRLDQQGRRLRNQGARIQQTETLMHHVVENSFDAVMTLHEDGTVATFNRAAERMFGCPTYRAVGRNVRELISIGAAGDPAAVSLERMSASTEPWEVQGRGATGGRFAIEMTLSAMTMEGVRLHVACMRDITERKAQHRMLERQATHDSLTDLPNRYLLQERLDDALTVARSTHAPVAFLLLDLDRFKEINDTLGHHTGDALLQHVAERLQSGLDEKDTISRLGGDEFAIVLPHTDEFGARQKASELVRMLADPFEVDGLTLQADTAIGIAVFPEHGTDGEGLFQRADVAMYAAKRKRTGVAVYDPEHDVCSVRQLTLTSELRNAIENDNGLMLMYQPKVNAASGEAAGVEALIRWNHEKLGSIRPDEFIGLAENSGLIKPLTRWVLRTALSQCAAWRREGLELNISVNVSARNLLEEELPQKLVHLLAEYAVEPSRLTLEITENVLMENPDAALEVVTELASIGIGISIDDFGTGYSSLGYLRRLPAQEIKIDRCFIMHMDQNPDDATIVRSTIELAHNLGRTVVAEGVETEGIWQTLRHQGVDVGQGYLFSKPLAADDLVDWAQRQRPEASDELVSA